MASIHDNDVEYERLRTLGSGSYGEAVLVQRTVQGQTRQFVIKQVEATKMTPEELQKAEQEASVLRKLAHSNIIAYTASFIASGKLCIVTEYADGGDLGDAIKGRLDAGGGFDDSEIFNIFVQLCLALRHVHLQQIIHRDLKAKNVFLTGSSSGPNMTVKLGDFGIARVMSSSGSLAETQIGTPYYLSPEIYEDKPYGKKSDMWSLGVLLYEVIALELPFKASNIAALARKVLSEPPSRLPNPRRGASDVPVVAKASSSFFSFSATNASRSPDQGKPGPALYPEGFQGLVDTLLRKAPEDRPTADSILRSQPVVRNGISALLGCSVPPPFVRENLDDLQDMVSNSTADGVGLAVEGGDSGLASTGEQKSGRRGRRITAGGSESFEEFGDDDFNSSDSTTTPRRGGAPRRRGSSALLSSGRIRGTPRQKDRTGNGTSDYDDDPFLDALAPATAVVGVQHSTHPPLSPPRENARLSRAAGGGGETAAERREKARRARVQQRMKHRNALPSPSSKKQSQECTDETAGAPQEGSNEDTAATDGAEPATSEDQSPKYKQPPPAQIDTGRGKNRSSSGGIAGNESPTTRRSPTASLRKMSSWIFGSGKTGGCSGGGGESGGMQLNGSWGGGEATPITTGDMPGSHQTFNPHFVPEHIKTVAQPEAPPSSTGDPSSAKPELQLPEPLPAATGSDPPSLDNLQDTVRTSNAQSRSLTIEGENSSPASTIETKSRRRGRRINGSGSRKSMEGGRLASPKSPAPAAAFKKELEF